MSVYAAVCAPWRRHVFLFSLFFFFFNLRARAHNHAHFTLHKHAAAIRRCPDWEHRLVLVCFRSHHKICPICLLSLSFFFSFLPWFGRQAHRRSHNTGARSGSCSTLASSRLARGSTHTHTLDHLSHSQTSSRSQVPHGHRGMVIFFFLIYLFCFTQRTIIRREKETEEEEEGGGQGKHWGALDVAIFIAGPRCVLGKTTQMADHA